MNRIIETMGSIAKVEKLETLNSNILENTLVLEEIEPFPGYHGANLPSGYNPVAVYLVLKKKISTVKLMRITQQIRKYYKPGFDGTPAEICINNDVFSCIRLRNLNSYDNIPELQNHYMHEGLRFMKKKKMAVWAGTKPLAGVYTPLRCAVISTLTRNSANQTKDCFSDR